MPDPLPPTAATALTYCSLLSFSPVPVLWGVLLQENRLFLIVWVGRAFFAVIHPDFFLRHEAHIHVQPRLATCVWAKNRGRGHPTAMRVGHSFLLPFLRNECFPRDILPTHG